jgi:hypothetical protein
MKAITLTTNIVTDGYEVHERDPHCAGLFFCAGVGVEVKRYPGESAVNI